MKEENKSGGVWVKASERLPIEKAHWNQREDNEFPVRMKGRYYMAEIYDEALKGEAEKLSIHFNQRHHFENEFSEIEWLDESLTPLAVDNSGEDYTETIQNALYATGKFTTDGCEVITYGIINYLKDSGFGIVKANQPTKESAEEVLNKHSVTETGGYQVYPEKWKIINAMEEYASQSNSMKTAEEIRNSFIRSCVEGYQDAKISGKKVENFHGLVNMIQLREWCEYLAQSNSKGASNQWRITNILNGSNSEVDGWVKVEDNPLPLETDILVKHPHGIEAIHFYIAKWTYWYSAAPVHPDLLKSITHWMNPKNITLTT